MTGKGPDENKRWSHYFSKDSITEKPISQGSQGILKQQQQQQNSEQNKHKKQKRK